MIVSVTALGSRDGDAAGAVARVVSYLDGRAPCPPGRSPEWWDGNNLDAKAPCPHGLEAPGDGAVAYYADSVEGPGRWLGRGMAGFSPAGEVARSELAAMLLGKHPATGAQLLDGRGSATRAQHLGRRGEAVAPIGPDNELLTLPQAATLLGLSPEYLRRVASATAAAQRELGNVAGNVAEADGTLRVLDGPYLVATRGGPKGHWRVARAEVARFDAARRAPTAVIGYDLTFSVPKSVSILWAHADAAGRDAIVEAVDAAVAAGVAYIQEHAAFIRSGPGSSLRKARGLLAASYLHGTSRALDPQLHAHVVVANMAEGPGGQVRAIDGRALFTHAKTAGYLAAAELRHQLARRLGVEWEAPERGLADIAGVPREAIVAMSKRSQELEAVIGDLERFFAGGRRLGARGRQMAAYITRAAKDEHGVDPGALRPWWQTQLDGVGFGPRAAGRCLDRQAAPVLVTEEDRVKLSRYLGSHEGLTETEATFTRRDVLQRVAEWAGDRLGAADIADLADSWLASDVVVRLEPDHEHRRQDRLQLRSGRTVNAAGVEAVFTTESMLGVEQELFATYARGRHVGASVVTTEGLEGVLASRPELGDDQVAMVRSICTSGHRIQCVLGPAGSGKTFALAAAARAWEDAGYVPVGACVQGTATEVLRDATGMECSTVAHLLTSLHFGLVDTLSPRHVVVVDESSTLGNRDLARLARYVEAHGAALRLIGDPAQHSAVVAGGGWRALLERYPEDRAELVERRRQSAPEMAQVRLASVEYAAGQIEQAIERLRRNDRVVEADTPDELLDKLVADWYVERLRRTADPSLPASSMMADHHVERRQLNDRARALLMAQGQLRGPSVEVAGQCFAVGDEVIDVKQERSLFPKGGNHRHRVRTGERGVVVEVQAGKRPAVVVDFERRGRVEVAERFLSQRVRPGVVGVIAHSYAVTSNMAEGETYYGGRHLSTDGSSREGVYVGLTRGRFDAKLYMVRRRELVPPVDAHLGLPRLDDETATVKAVTRRLEAQRAERLASEVDPTAAEVARLVRSHSLASLAELAQNDDALALWAYRQAAMAVAQAARLDPEPTLVARLGSRPEGGTERAVWDRAVGAVAVHRARFAAVAVDGGGGAEWALGLAPREDRALQSYAKAAAALATAEQADLARLPVASLAEERGGLLRSLAGGPAPEAHHEALAAVATCRRGLNEAVDERTVLAERAATLGGTRRWRRNAQSIEAARRNLAGAERRVAVAEVALARAEAGLGAVEQRLPDRNRLAERLELIDHVLDAKVAQAAERPAPYVVAALAEMDGPPALRHEAAARIESYRHRELGRSPADGAFVGQSGLAGAIGPCPADYLESLAWDHVAELAAPDLALAVDAPGVDLGL